MMTVLLIVFTSFTVIYIMNLLIGLLNLAIENYNANSDEKFLLLKAKVLCFNIIIVINKDICNKSNTTITIII
jgi:hypothetical protein